MTARVVGVVIAHDDVGLADLLASLGRFAPGMDIALFDSGPGDLGARFGYPTIPASRPLRYAKIGACYLDIMEWFAGHGQGDAWVSLETDMLFTRPGFCDWAGALIAGSRNSRTAGSRTPYGGGERGADYVAARLTSVDAGSRWRPARSLRASGRRRLLDILGADTLYGAFSPGQVFSKRFCHRMAAHPRFAELKRFVEEQEPDGGAYSMQETVLPTAAMAWGLTVATYPESSRYANRYRPYFGRSGALRALADEDVYFVHPVRRDPGDRARRVLCAQP